MAAALVKSMSRLSLSCPAMSKQSCSIFSWCKPSHKSWNPSFNFKPMPMAATPQNTARCRLLPSFDIKPPSARSVTYEIKQWREHRVVNRFYRLHWGGWIRCRGGRNRKLYRKSPKARWLLRQHIFCNKTQNQKLDRLVTPHWKEPKYFVDSPYEHYHQRTNCLSFPQRRKFYP